MYQENTEHLRTVMYNVLAHVKPTEILQCCLSPGSNFMKLFCKQHQITQQIVTEDQPDPIIRNDILAGIWCLLSEKYCDQQKLHKIGSSTYMWKLCLLIRMFVNMQS